MFNGLKQKYSVYICMIILSCKNPRILTIRYYVYLLNKSEYLSSTLLNLIMKFSTY